MWKRRLQVGVVLGMAVALAPAGCARKQSQGGAEARTESTSTATAPLQQNPTIPGFAVYAEHGARLQANARVTGGDVGVELPDGPFLDGAHSLALRNNATVDPAHDVLAATILLDNNASVGDVETNRLVAPHATYGTVRRCPRCLPPRPW